MNDDERLEMTKNRDYNVYKSNDLVLKSRYRYTAQQQKALAFICSLIKPTPSNKEPQLEYTFKISDYCKIVGIEMGGKQCKTLKENLELLAQKTMWLKIINKDGKECDRLVHWFDEADILSADGTVTVRINRTLIAYLFDLQEKFYSFGLWNVLYFRSKYSQHFYELFKAWYGLERARLKRKSIDTPTLDYTVNVEELQHTLMTDEPPERHKYKNFADFRRKVIEPAQRDINTYSDISFEFETITRGRKTVKILFHIKQKETIDRLNTMDKAFLHMYPEATELKATLP